MHLASIEEYRDGVLPVTSKPEEEMLVGVRPTVMTGTMISLVK